MKGHAIGGAAGQGGVERLGGFAPHQAYGGKTVQPPGRRYRRQVVGVGPAEGEQPAVALAARFEQVVLELAGLVARQVRANKVVAPE